MQKVPSLSFLAFFAPNAFRDHSLSRAWHPHGSSLGLKVGVAWADSIF